jgi:hypothetical protein
MRPNPLMPTRTGPSVVVPVRVPIRVCVVFECISLCTKWKKFDFNKLRHSILNMRVILDASSCVTASGTCGLVSSRESDT